MISASISDRNPPLGEIDRDLFAATVARFREMGTRSQFWRGKFRDLLPTVRTNSVWADKPVVVEIEGTDAIEVEEVLALYFLLCRGELSVHFLLAVPFWSAIVPEIMDAFAARRKAASSLRSALSGSAVAEVDASDDFDFSGEAAFCESFDALCQRENEQNTKTLLEFNLFGILKRAPEVLPEVPDFYTMALFHIYKLPVFHFETVLHCFDQYGVSKLTRYPDQFLNNEEWSVRLARRLSRLKVTRAKVFENLNQVITREWSERCSFQSNPRFWQDIVLLGDNIDALREILDSGLVEGEGKNFWGRMAIVFREALSHIEQAKLFEYDAERGLCAGNTAVVYAYTLSALNREQRASKILECVDIETINWPAFEHYGLSEVVQWFKLQNKELRP